MISLPPSLPSLQPVPELLSLGYGFVELSHAAAGDALLRQIAIERGVEIDGHILEVKISDRAAPGAGLAGASGAAAAAAGGASSAPKKTSILEAKGIITDEKLKQQEDWSKRSSKLMVRNIPFQANPKEIRELFQAFGQLRRLRMPKKFDGTTHRGYGFVEFVTPQEARSAFASLQATHLYGRHLVLEWASPDETMEELREKAGRSVEG